MLIWHPYQPNQDQDIKQSFIAKNIGTKGVNIQNSNKFIEDFADIFPFK